MISFIVWIIGTALGLLAAYEIITLPGDMAKKLLFIVAVLLTSWLGLAVYYFWAREQIGKWVK